MRGQNPEHWDSVSCAVRNRHIDTAQAAMVALIQSRCFGGDCTVILPWWLTDWPSRLIKCFPLSQTRGTVTSWVPQFLNCRNRASLQRWRTDGGRKNVVEASAWWVAVIIELVVSYCWYWMNGELLALLNWWVASTIKLASFCHYWISGELLSLLNWWWVAVIIELAVSCCHYWISGELLSLLNWWWVAVSIELVVSCCLYWISGDFLSAFN